VTPGGPHPAALGLSVGAAVAVPPAIEARGLVARYGDRIALAGVDLTVAPGERVALLGPNGAGKSTLLSVLATLHPLAGGIARVTGIDVAADPAAARRRLGVVFQGPSLDRKLTVEENLRLLGRLYGLSGERLRGRVTESLAAVGLAERRRDRVLTLSGGLARRLELARALLARPDVLLLDEPTGGLDPAARAEFWAALAAASEQGTAVLFATHQGEEADRAHRVLVFDQGRIVAEGDPDTLKAAVGGDVIVLECDDAPALADALRAAFGGAVAAVGSEVHVERERAHELVPRLVESVPGRIRSLMLRRPTLEDVFVHFTGLRFRDREGA
jgi:ABC-2 type transport system ATP-binding protein